MKKYNQIIVYLSATYQFFLFAFFKKIRYTVFKAFFMKQSALVLSGGGALGIAHLWAVFALKSEWYAFDWYAWVSAGAIVAASLAVGFSPLQIKDIYHNTSLLSLADMGWHTGGILTGNKIHSLFQELFWHKTFQDLNVPLYIGATNYENGERIMINKWLISDAVRASVAVPWLIAPLYHPEYGAYLTDGWNTHNFPLDTASENYTGDVIVWVDVMTDLIDIVDHDGALLDLSLSQHIQRTVQIFLKNQPLPDDQRIKIYRPALKQFNSFDVFHFENIWQVGYESVCPE